MAELVKELIRKVDQQPPPRPPSVAISRSKYAKTDAEYAATNAEQSGRTPVKTTPSAPTPKPPAAAKHAKLATAADNTANGNPSEWRAAGGAM